MLNRFQTDILMYLEATSNHFIDTLMKKNDGHFIVIENLMPDLVTYLGAMIKRDLDLHAEKSEGYNRLEDMLIEIHIVPKKEFSDALLKKALEPLRSISY